MGYLSDFFLKLTYTKALEQADGKLESDFFTKIYRIWYIVGHSAVDKSISYLIYKTTIRLMIGLLIVGEIVFCATELSTLDEVTDVFNLMIVQALTFYRYWNMVLNNHVYRKLATAMESPYFDISTEGRRQVFDYWKKKNETYLRLILVLGNCTLAVWYLYPLLDEFEYNIFIRVTIPFSYQSPGRYAAVYLVLMLTFTSISYFIMTNDLVMQTYLLHLVCQFDVLSNCFTNIQKECEAQFQGEPLNELFQNEAFEKLYKKRMGELVHQHRYILRLVMDFRRTLSGPMLGQLLASGIMICFVGYQAATIITEDLTKGIMAFLYLGYNLFEFYIMCRWCEEITTQSQKIGEAVYFSQWESGVTKFTGVRASILIIIARANKPLIFTAGGMYDLTLESYSSLVKASYSALSVLLGFRQSE